ncbi:PREDICTED: probable serine/threonine-protein kinase DDB_G0284251 [Priapulus caudatus]|uniref:Probable serine/threonine-protein kinase DDB_G0284251 n=1 Tax=Priapulus caudatus TaxID=37621 RepID=A0ABM1DYI9_PRICU|nr:PREDICTED: probable serine/threonine-protein kinase DDB_G0284251 [Priapulus caudatus]
MRRLGDGWSPTKRKHSVLEQMGYTLGKEIGESTYSKIREAHSAKLNKKVAVKIICKKKLPAEYVEKFLPREIAIMQHLRHPRVIDLHEAIETKGALYLVMEHLPNGDLLSYINECGPLPEEDCLLLFRQLLEVVGYCHRQGVFHRDIKLENILLGENNTMKLCDFGLAVIPEVGRMLQTTCGSYVYAAPEILEGATYDGEKADVWSMGVCLYGMLCGKLPFHEESTDVLMNSLQEKIKFTTKVSKSCHNYNLYRDSGSTCVCCEALHMLQHQMVDKDFCQLRQDGLLRANGERLAEKTPVHTTLEESWNAPAANAGQSGLELSAGAGCGLEQSTGRAGWEPESQRQELGRRQSQAASVCSRPSLVLRHGDDQEREVEHGFTCEQHSREEKTPQRVTKLLTSVAKCHSTGKSKASVMHLKGPKAVTSKSSLYGITGPALHRITSHQQLTEHGGQQGRRQSMWGQVAPPHVQQRRKSAWGPSQSTTMLPQANIMASLHNMHEKQVDREMRTLQYSAAGKSRRRRYAHSGGRLSCCNATKMLLRETEMKAHPETESRSGAPRSPGGRNKCRSDDADQDEATMTGRTIAERFREPSSPCSGSSPALPLLCSSPALPLAQALAQLCPAFAAGAYASHPVPLCAGYACQLWVRQRRRSDVDGDVCVQRLLGATATTL